MLGLAFSDGSNNLILHIPGGGNFVVQHLFLKTLKTVVQKALLGKVIISCLLFKSKARTCFVNVTGNFISAYKEEEFNDIFLHHTCS